MTEHSTSGQSAHSRGKIAVAEALRRNHVSESETSAPVSDWYPQASEVIDAYLRASNPVGESETIYDDFYRLRSVARAALKSWDSGSGTADQADMMEALRAVLVELTCV